MTEEELKGLLGLVRAGELGVDEAMGRLRDLPYEDLGYAKVDHHRALRRGFPEVIFGPGKSRDQVLGIAQSLARQGPVLATRLEPQTLEALVEGFPGAQAWPDLGMAFIGTGPAAQPGQRVAVVSGGTADHRVAEEAALTAQVLGNEVDRVYDVGVAGLHRLLAQRPVLHRATVVVVVAGMEGALASVVAGLVDAPVIAVPTSVGYGASLQGLAALLSMLNSCSSGLGVVNIDNGFGAGYLAASITRQIVLRTGHSLGGSMPPSS